MEGQDLSVLLEGRGPEQRPHFTLGYSEFVWARDEGYAMFGRNDGEEAKLYDLWPTRNGQDGCEAPRRGQADVRRVRYRRRGRPATHLLTRGRNGGFFAAVFR